MKLLNATGENIKKTLEKDYSKDNGFNEKTLYYGCIQGMSKVKLNKITLKDIEGPIKTFLINWGTMRRVLDRKKEWEKDLEKALRSKCNALDVFRNKNLLTSDIEKIDVKKSIINCYENVEKRVGPVAASKILHIIAPIFFPMWDGAIRTTISQDYKDSKIFARGIGASSVGYYKFMQATKYFILSNLKREEVINLLSKNLILKN